MPVVKVLFTGVTEMAQPQYDRIDETAVQRIPPGYPYTVRIANASAVEEKVIAVYIGTDRIARKNVTLTVAAGPAPSIDVPWPIPPATEEQIANDVDLSITPIP